MSGWWGWPWGSEPSAILYNESMFEEAGLGMPYDLWKEDEWTWNAFLDAAKALTKVDSQGFAQQLGSWDPLDVNATEVFIKANDGTGWFSEDGLVVTVTEALSLRGYWRTLRERMACKPAMIIRRLMTRARMGRRMKMSVNFIPHFNQEEGVLGRLRQ